MMQTTSTLTASLLLVSAASAQPVYTVHDMSRPLPARVTVADQPLVPAPGDATVLLDGTSLDAWTQHDGTPCKWTLHDDGSMQVKPGTGGIQTAESFGDIHLHIEWMVPESEADDEGQGRGNSGVFLMGLYEVQVLESTGSDTYADGMAGSLYGQRPPVWNAGAGIGKWNTYDILFRAPRFDGDRCTDAATVTVIHNGIVIHNHVDLMGPTKHKQTTSYEPHAATLPISLQDHGDPIRFRNIWVRPLY